MDGGHIDGGCTTIAGAHQIKQARLTAGTGFLSTTGGIEDLVKHGEFLTTRTGQRIKGTGLDETFEDAFVDEFLVDAIGKVR